MEIEKKDILWLISVAFHGVKLNERRELTLRTTIDLEDISTANSEKYMSELINIINKYGFQETLKRLQENWTYEDDDYVHLYDYSKFIGGYENG